MVAEALLHRIGEAVSRLPDALTSAHPEVERRKIMGMRKVMAHEYELIDYRTVWRALDQALPGDVESITADRG
ncbi:HepT-like ribonuclease domain-containing protein [Microlunatus endophyticus]|uniref:HepT-like ribonuclease domain-containing protein n=1 Tax=Microlunatus endophyticus TaxID=1716077 RepID=UPI001E322A17|nr:HepT-like ribonuclease domain-containing protein [Microlunatus endophyticus]